MYAVIQTGGKQYRVSEGDVITVEKLKAEVDSKIEFNEVLLVGDGGEVKIGTPYLDATKVVGSVLESGKGKKVIIFKYKSKKDYRKKQGHRQPFTMVRIDEIVSEGKSKAKKVASKKEEVAPKEETEPKGEAAPKEPAVKRTRVKKETTEEKPLATDDKPEEEKKPAVKRTRVKKETTEKTPVKAEKITEEKTEGEKKPAARKPRAKKEVPVDGE